MFHNSLGPIQAIDQMCLNKEVFFTRKQLQPTFSAVT